MRILVIDGEGREFERVADTELKERNMALGDGKETVVLSKADVGVVKFGGLQIIDDTPQTTEQENVPPAESPTDHAGVQTTTAEVAAPPVAQPPDAIVAAIRKRHEFWRGKMSTATSEAEVEAAADAIQRIEKEAEKAGVNLSAQPSGVTATGVASLPGTVAAKKKSKKSAKAQGTVPQSVLDSEALSNDKAKRLAAQTAERPAGEARSVVQGVGAEGAVRITKAKVQRPCLDGCGIMVNGKFAMGHDAKLKSILIKVEKGELAPDAIPDIAQDYVKLRKGELEILKDSTGTKTMGQLQHYVILAAPVRFQGRPEIQYTEREQ